MIGVPRVPCLVALAVAVGVTAPAPAHAGAWTRPRGDAYVKIAGAGIDTRSRYNQTGDRVGFGETGTPSPPVTYQSRELRLYLEYGATETVTLVGSCTYKELRTEQSAVVSESKGAGDLYAGVRIRLRGGAVPVSLSGDAKIPTGYDIREQPVLGGGKACLTGRLLVGTSLGRAYATADAGLTYRAGSFRNELVFSGEVGSRISGPIRARTRLHVTRALGSVGNRTQGAIFDPGLASPRMLLLDGAVGVDLGEGVSVEAALSNALSGRDALAGNTVEIGLVMMLGEK
jgi:hypothetical protein